MEVAEFHYMSLRDKLMLHSDVELPKAHGFNPMVVEHHMKPRLEIIKSRKNYLNPKMNPNVFGTENLYSETQNGIIMPAHPYLSVIK